MNKFIIYIIIIIISEIDLYYINASNVDEYSDCHRDDLKWPPLPGVYRNNAYHIRKNGDIALRNHFEERVLGQCCMNGLHGF